MRATTKATKTILVRNPPARRRGGPSGPHARKSGASADTEALCERACRLWDRHRNKQAFALFHAAALMGDVIGQLNVGYSYAAGKGFREKGNFNAARTWFLRAVAKGDPSSAIDIAKLYLARGKTSRAQRYLSYAASQPEWLSLADIEEVTELLRSVK